MFSFYKWAASDSKSARKNRHSLINHVCKVENLEERALLSAVALSAQEYSNISAAYSELELPQNMNDLNIITLDLSKGDGLAQLKAAIAEASTETYESDLIVVRTSQNANTIKYTAAADQLSISLNSDSFGSITIVGYGSKPLTLDANKCGRIASIQNTAADVNFVNMTFTNGKVNTNKSVSGYGGAIYSQSTGTVTLTDCTVSNNIGCQGAGLYLANGTYVIRDCELSGQTSGDNGGAIYASYATLTIEDSDISKNKATYNPEDKVVSVMHGGGLYAYGSNSTIKNTNFEDNEGCSGGAIFANFGNFTMEGCSVVGNKGTSGGGIYTEKIQNAVLIDTDISGNTANDGGGGMCVMGNGTYVYTGCTFSNNSVTESGGGIRIHYGTHTFTDCAVTGNTATKYGGGVSLSSQGNITMTNTVIEENSVSYSSDTDGTTIGGGGIYKSHDNPLTLENCKVINNSVSATGTAQTTAMGGGIWEYDGVNSGLRLSITNTLIAGNSASGTSTSSGGGIYLTENPYDSRTTTKILNSTIAGNSAITGSGIVLGGSHALLINSIIAQNYGKSSLAGSYDTANSRNNLIDVNPNFVKAPVFSGSKLTNADTMDLHLAKGSCAINAGYNNAITAETDLDGNGRKNGTVDIGAYEYWGPAELDLNPTLQKQSLGSSKISYTSEWSSVCVELWASSSGSNTFSITYDPSMYTLNTTPLRKVQGVNVTIGNPVTKNGMATAAVTLTIGTEAKLSTSGTQVAALELTPAGKCNLGAKGITSSKIMIDGKEHKFNIVGVPYDLDPDGVIGINDLVVFAKNFGKNSSVSDFNFDECTDIKDLVEFAKNFGKTARSGDLISYHSDFIKSLLSSAADAPAESALVSEEAEEFEIPAPISAAIPAAVIPAAVIPAAVIPAAVIPAVESAVCEVSEVSEVSEASVRAFAEMEILPAKTNAYAELAAISPAAVLPAVNLESAALPEETKLFDFALESYLAEEEDSLELKLETLAYALQ